MCDKYFCILSSRIFLKHMTLLLLLGIRFEEIDDTEKSEVEQGAWPAC